MEQEASNSFGLDYCRYRYLRIVQNWKNCEKGKQNVKDLKVPDSQVFSCLNISLARYPMTSRILASISGTVDTFFNLIRWDFKKNTRKAQKKLRCKKIFLFSWLGRVPSTVNMFLSLENETIGHLRHFTVGNTRRSSTVFVLQLVFFSYNRDSV